MKSFPLLLLPVIITVSCSNNSSPDFTPVYLRCNNFVNPYGFASTTSIYDDNINTYDFGHNASGIIKFLKTSNNKTLLEVSSGEYNFSCSL